jgi:hypothetical protein
MFVGEAINPATDALVIAKCASANMIVRSEGNALKKKNMMYVDNIIRITRKIFRVLIYVSALIAIMIIAMIIRVPYVIPSWGRLPKNVTKLCPRPLIPSKR